MPRLHLAASGSKASVELVEETASLATRRRQHSLGLALVQRAQHAGKFGPVSIAVAITLYPSSFGIKGEADQF
jgi:hypothetical protein